MTILTSPSNSALTLPLFISNEGISHHYDNIDVYEGIISIGELCDQIAIETNSDLLDETEKMQRDVLVSRVNAICDYLKRKNTVFPGITVFVNRLDKLETHNISGRKIAVSRIKAGYDRFCGDGQGRISAFLKHKSQLEALCLEGVDGAQDELDLLLNQTLNMKLVVTNTTSIAEVSHIVRQCFADYHLKLKRPSTSLSLYFDAADPTSCFIRSLLDDCTLYNRPLLHYIALNGKIKHQQIWTLIQFKTLIITMTGKTNSEFGKHISDTNAYNQWLDIFKKVLGAYLANLPMDKLVNSSQSEFRVNHNQALFTKALFAKALGYLGLSVLDNAIKNGHLDLTPLKQLNDLELLDLGNPYWEQNKIVEAGKIIPKTDKRIASLLCRELQIYPCAALMQ